jgi:hypothetical protein
MIYCFGDSWAAGAELKYKQHPFVHWLAEHLNTPYKNFGKNGNSLGLIVHSITQELNNIQSSDIVLVVIPPDSRWYDENSHQGFYSLSSSQREDFLKFLNYKTLEWFKYHHALFVYLIQKMLTDRGCYYIMMHNYGQIDNIKNYNLNIDYDRFLNQQDLTTLLSEKEYTWTNYPDHLEPEHRFDNTDGPSLDIFIGKYFEGCKCHPNELGHKRIAELTLEKYNNDKK